MRPGDGSNPTSAIGPIAGRVAVRARLAPSAPKRLSSPSPSAAAIIPLFALISLADVGVWVVTVGWVKAPTVAVGGAPPPTNLPSTAIGWLAALSRSDARISISAEDNSVAASSLPPGLAWLIERFF